VLKLFRQLLASEIRRAEWTPQAQVPVPATGTATVEVLTFRTINVDLGHPGALRDGVERPLRDASAGVERPPIMPSREPESVDQLPFKSMFTSGTGRAVYLSHDPHARAREEQRKERKLNFELDGRE
jgi:hypothetical protein